MLTLLFTAPSATSTLTDAAVWTTALVPEFLVIAGVVIGILAAGYFINKIISSVLAGIKKVTTGGRRGGRRRR